MKRHVGETELYELERYCSNAVNVCLEPVLRLIQEVRERRTHEDKYRWHDLRIDPTDVPDGKRFVEVRTEDSFPYYFGWYDDETVEGGAWYDSTGFSMTPYKWREIEEEVIE